MPALKFNTMPGGTPGASITMRSTFPSIRGDTKMLARREMIGVVALAGAVAARPVMAQSSMPMPVPKSTSGRAEMSMEDCITLCMTSHRSCLQTAQHCIEKTDRNIPASHIATLLDCAELCLTTAHSMLRHSPQHMVLCDACARICDACATSCERFPADKVMADCAKQCRTCAEACRHMASMH